MTYIKLTILLVIFGLSAIVLVNPVRADNHAEGIGLPQSKNPAIEAGCFEWSQGESNPSSRTSTRRGRTSGGPLNSTKFIITQKLAKNKSPRFIAKSRTFGALNCLLRVDVKYIIA